MFDEISGNAAGLDLKFQCNSMTFYSKDFLSISKGSCGSKWMSDFYDVRITDGDQEIQAHRIILAKHSDYFKLRLKNHQLESNGNCTVVAINGVKWNCVEIVVEFMYTSHITVTSENVYDLVVASDYFYMPEIKKFCLEFLETYLHSDNCLEVLDFAIYRNIEDLKEKAETCLLKNFRYVVHCQAFKDLSLLRLSNLFHTIRDSSNKVCESVFFQAITQWTKSHPECEMHFADLFDLIRLEQLKLSYLVNTVATEELVTDSLYCLQKLVKAIRSHFDKDNGKNASPPTPSVSIVKLYRQQHLFSECFTEGQVDSWFVVSSDWMSKWVKYVTNDGYEWDTEMRVPDLPGPIDNTLLFTNDSYKFLKRTLKPNVDYKFIPESAWELLSSWYGVTEGQPPVGEKGPMFEQHKLIEDDEDFVIDPICLHLKSFSSLKTRTKTFSKWDTIEKVVKEIKKLFKLAEDSQLSLHSGFYRLDEKKRIAECDLIENKILFHEIFGIAEKVASEAAENFFPKVSDWRKGLYPASKALNNHTSSKTKTDEMLKKLECIGQKKNVIKSTKSMPVKSKEQLKPEFEVIKTGTSSYSFRIPNDSQKNKAAETKFIDRETSAFGWNNNNNSNTRIKISPTTRKPTSMTFSPKSVQSSEGKKLLLE